MHLTCPWDAPQDFARALGVVSVSSASDREALECFERAILPGEAKRCRPEFENALPEMVGRRPHTATSQKHSLGRDLFGISFAPKGCAQR